MSLNNELQQLSESVKLPHEVREEQEERRKSVKRNAKAYNESAQIRDNGSFSYVAQKSVMNERKTLVFAEDKPYTIEPGTIESLSLVPVMFINPLKTVECDWSPEAEEVEQELSTFKTILNKIIGVFNYA